MDTFKRAQVEKALWRVFRRKSGTAPPSVFRNRIKKLLDLDRQIDFYPDHELQPQNRAFFDADPAAKGADIPFTRKNAYAIGVGLHLLDAGFAQSEVVFVMKWMRDEALLDDIYDHISQFHISLSMAQTTREFGVAFPTRPAPNEGRVDWGIYLIIRNIRLKEAWGIEDQDKEFILRPEVKHGVVQLMEYFDKATYELPVHTVVELTALCVRLNEELTKLITED